MSLIDILANNHTSSEDMATNYLVEQTLLYWCNLTMGALINLLTHIARVSEHLSQKQGSFGRLYFLKPW